MAQGQSEMDMEQVLEVSMPDSSVWQVPCDLIALAWAATRARRVARDGEGDPEVTFQQEYDTTIEDEDLLLERAAQLNWIDIEGGAMRIKRAGGSLPPGHQWYYERGWFIGAKRIIP